MPAWVSASSLDQGPKLCPSQIALTLLCSAMLADSQTTSRLGTNIVSDLEAGHLARMNEDRSCKKIFLAKPMGNRPQSRPLLRWNDCVEKDLKILKVKNWKTVAKSRDVWRRPGPTQGCQAIEEGQNLRGLIKLNVVDKYPHFVV
ncbi:hypothetical protein TNCV_3056871 [Trichonephila clavipes]|nr:hypothetical protein TNCV_3056871 [Trichonephila clavipes]